MNVVTGANASSRQRDISDRDTVTLTVEVDYHIATPTTSRVTLARRRPQVRDQILTCQRCPLSTSGWVRAPVPYRGPSPAQFAVVGEAPGQQENRAGQPFIGPAGKLLEAMFVEAKLDPHACMYLNQVSCFPHGTPTDAHVNACRVNVDAQLELASTPWVLLVGGTALRAVRGDLASVTLVAGTGFVRGGRAYYVVLHPAYVLRNRNVREQVVEDLARWRDIIEGELSMGSMFATTCARCGNWVDHYDPEGIAWCAVHWRTRQVTVTEREREKVADKGKLVAVTRARLRRGRQGALA